MANTNGTRGQTIRPAHLEAEVYSLLGYNSALILEETSEELHLGCVRTKSFSRGGAWRAIMCHDELQGVRGEISLYPLV